MKYTLIQLALVVFLGISPLIRFSIENTHLPRDTKILITLGAIVLSIFFGVYHSRVQALGKILLLLTGTAVASTFLLGIFSSNSFALLFLVIAIAAGTAFWILRKEMRSILIATIIGCIGIYAQWGIAQFIVQDDLGLYVIGETRIATGSPGIASFTIGYEKFIRAYGPFAHPNSLGGVLALGLILLFTIRSAPRLYSASLLLTIVLGSIVAFSRASLLASGIITLAIAIRMRHYKLLAYILISSTLFVPLLSGRSFDPRGVALEDRQQGIIWMKQMMRLPTLTRGYGIGNYERALATYLSDQHIQHNAWDIAPVHTVPLLVFMELGGISSLILVSVLIYFFYHYRASVLLALLPPLLLDHYFFSSLSPLLFLITSVLLVVQYRRGHSTY